MKPPTFASISQIAVCETGLKIRQQIAVCRVGKAKCASIPPSVRAVCLITAGFFCRLLSVIFIFVQGQLEQQKLRFIGKFLTRFVGDGSIGIEQHRTIRMAHVALNSLDISGFAELKGCA